MIGLPGIQALVRGDAGADSVVPPSGFTARLVIFAAAAMAFLAVFALALSLASGRLADRWGLELAQSSTIRISAPASERATQTETALRILQSTAGVSFARALSTEEQQALLEPWFGPELDVANLPVPQLIEVITENDFEPVSLKLRLEAELPDAVFDDHGTWRAPLIKSAHRLRFLGLMSVVLLGLSMAAMVTLAANASLAANSQVIRVLCLVGATDQFISRAFERRFTLRALIGAAGGAVMGMVAIALLPSASEEGGFLTGLGFQGPQWLVPICLPLFAGLVAFLATRWSAGRVLRELS